MLFSSFITCHDVFIFMKDTSKPSDAASAVRRFRERQRALGLVKKDVWIRPEHAATLAGIEQQLRQPSGSAQVGIEAQPWTVPSVQAALLETPLAAAGLLGVSRIEGVEPTLRLSVLLPSSPAVDVLLAIGGDQILVEAFLWPVSAILDPAAFNECVLRTHKFLPLSNFSITDVAGQPVYTIFGALDVRSTLSSLVFEIQSVAEAVLSADTLYGDYLDKKAVPHG